MLVVKLFIQSKARIRFLFISFVLVLGNIGYVTSTNNVKDQQWKDWNYYQLLGLQPINYYSKDGQNSFRLKPRRQRQQERGIIQTKDIKKAYRKEAQKWHPDKIQSRKKQQENSTSAEINGVDYRNLSVGECNERFAKIADAYSVLTDEKKRREYDLFLLDAEEEMEREHKRNRFNNSSKRTQSSSNTNSRSSSNANASTNSGSDFFRNTNQFFSDFFTDPMATFEDFFFGENDGSGSFMEDLFGSFYKDGSDNSNNRNSYHDRMPDRTSETTQVRYDSRLRTEVLRVLQREEFDEPKESRVFFRVIAQEFVEDRYGYSPISEPQIIDEGYLPMRKPQSQFSRRSSSRNKRKRGRSNKRQPLSITSHRLEKYEFMTPNTIHLVAKNGQYYAGLTSECELVIMRDNGPFEEDVEIWSSDTYAPPQHQNGCALAMYNAQIAIVIGDIENPTTILWSSPKPPPIVPGSPFDGEEIIDYYCSLDDDGSLAVYRTREQTELSITRQDLIDVAKMWWNDLVKGKSRTPPKTQAAVTWKSIQRWAQLHLRGKPSIDRPFKNSKTGKTEKNVDECVYATGIAGCNTAGRHAIHISKNIKRSFGKAMSQVDEKVEGFIDFLYDGDTDDIDILQKLNRCIDEAIRKGRIILGRFSRRFVDRAIDVWYELRYRYSKWEKIIRYESADVMYHLRYKAKKFQKILKIKFEQMMNGWEM